MSKDVEITVRGYHLDVYQHVNNARYLEFLEEGRWVHLNSQNLFEEFKKRNLGFAVVNININYRIGARMNDVLVVSTKTDRYTSRTAIMKQVITLKGTDKVVADAEITFVIFDLEKNKAIAIDDDIKALLEKADAA